MTLQNIGCYSIVRTSIVQSEIQWSWRTQPNYSPVVLWHGT